MAREIIEQQGMRDMYLSTLHHLFRDWNDQRDIIHLTSRDLLDQAEVGKDQIVCMTDQPMLIRQ